MKRHSTGLNLVISTVLLLGCGTMLYAQDTAGQNSPSSDNTKMNQRDRDPNQPTADRQKNNLSDRDITQRIRESIVHDKALSTYAHNIKVVAQNGQVTLRGPVRSDDEKRTIEAKAAEIAGEANVTSELTVKAKQ